MPASTRHGPLLDVYEKIIKKAFRMGRGNRLKTTNDIFSSKRGAKLVRMSVRAAERPNSHPQRIWAFKVRRLPLLTRQQHEMNPLKQWLSHIEGRGALQVTKSSAYNICLQAIGSCKRTSEKCAYFGFPRTPQNGDEARPSYRSGSSPTLPSPTNARDLNVMDTLNVTGSINAVDGQEADVHAATGNPDDEGASSSNASDILPPSDGNEGSMEGGRQGGDVLEELRIPDLRNDVIVHR